MNTQLHRSVVQSWQRAMISRGMLKGLIVLCPLAVAQLPALNAPFAYHTRTMILVLSVRSAEDCVIPARGKYAVHTGISIHVPHGTYGRVAPRSGLAAKHFIDTGAGVIDEDYRGEVLVLLFNHNDADFKGKELHR